MMIRAILEVLIGVIIGILIYRCCIVRRVRARIGQRTGNRTSGRNETNRSSGANASNLWQPSPASRPDPPASSPAGVAEASAAAGASSVPRKELVAKNLFSKTISREDSVAELASLLAASRGARDDLEHGEGSCEDPPQEETLQDRECQAGPPGQPNAPPMAAIRSLWSDWVAPPEDMPPEEMPQKKAPRPRAKPECTICLEGYSPGDIISWAKDGGDANPNSASADNGRSGCDHIFHQKCLVEWLQHHDECPLCRRTVVHQDAGVRFAGWDRINHV